MVPTGVVVGLVDATDDAEEADADAVEVEATDDAGGGTAVPLPASVGVVHWIHWLGVHGTPANTLFVAK